MDNEYSLNRQLQSYKEAINQSAIVIKSDCEGFITSVNEIFSRLSGYSLEDLSGQKFLYDESVEDNEALNELMFKSLKNGDSYKGVMKIKQKVGSYFWISFTTVTIQNYQENRPINLTIAHDITSAMAKKDMMLRHAYKQKLTNLPNRQQLFQDFKDKNIYAVAIFDIVEFNKFNDIFGYSNGNDIIIHIAKNLFNSISQKYKLYHIYEDEFLVASTSDETQEFLKDISELLESINHMQITFDEIELVIDLTCGVAFGLGEVLYQQASIALKHSRNFEEDLVIYSSVLDRQKELENNILWNKKIQDAIKQDRIVPYFQPIYDNNTNKIQKYEALVRLVDEDGTIHPPYKFLELSKKSKHYKFITQKMIAKSIEAFKDSDLEFSINLSTLDITNIKLNQFLSEQIIKHNIGHRIILEIVESESVQNFDDIKDFIDNFKAYGCKIAIDDFGSGYSNFSYLLQLDVDFIKIDGSLIKNITIDKNSEIIVNSIVSFAKSINIKTVAEFVKDKETFDKIVAFGVDYSQGYFISPPVPSPSFVNNFSI